MKNILLAALAAFTLAWPALAHGEDHGPNGGALIDAGPYHVELVASGAGLTLHITSHEADAPVPTAGATGFAVIQGSGGTERVDLIPADPNILTATAKADIGADARIAVTFTIAGQPAASGRFDLAKGHEGHDPAP